MIILLDEQITLLLRLMNAVVQGENYSIREFEEAIDFLANATALQCPFERQFSSQLGTALAKEIVAALTGHI
ncbi:MAG: hypothetical protein KME15_16130 [Drouetiella hepatica Uher 2000/2452]|jgi:hypothetical protein|uniref:Uncharacterized protein n=1 Tax=Drouetiella hepatica Uher 2000/2452 TaxID=904376 RepID=A0A951QE33_9CYAN|nr:hypothetical protein [Drouetiella hepatica Uher 2000/2452]